MTDLEKSQITNLRNQGYGYKKIGQLMGLSVNTVKTYCKRNNLGGDITAHIKIHSEKTCKNCGAPLIQTPGHKPRIFCSDACRTKWWNTHPNLVNHREDRLVVCRYCGKAFKVAKNSTRKYCSHSCYVADRFHGGDSK